MERLAVVLLFLSSLVVAETGLVPGSGKAIKTINFEAKDWKYNPEWPKSSREQDGNANYPTGYSVETKDGQQRNGDVFGSDYRGEPDVVKQVELADGSHMLMLKTCKSDIRGSNTEVKEDGGKEVPQDDLMFNMPQAKIETGPSIVYRIYVPDMKDWERRLGSHFGFRFSTKSEGQDGGRLFRRGKEAERYWPGIFIIHGQDEKTKQEFGYFMVRADENGHDYNPQNSPRILEAGFWSIGISFSPDKTAHYYVKKGLGNFTESDRIASHKPYAANGLVPDHTSIPFVNVCNDGVNWSTPLWLRQVELYEAYPDAKIASEPQPRLKRKGGLFRRNHDEPTMGDSRTR